MSSSGLSQCHTPSDVTRRLRRDITIDPAARIGTTAVTSEQGLDVGLDESKAVADEAGNAQFQRGLVDDGSSSVPAAGIVEADSRRFRRKPR